MYDADDLAWQAGTTAARIDVWARAGVLVPNDPDARPRLYDESEVRVARAAAALAPLGVPHPSLQAVADLVRALPGDAGEIVVHADGLVRFGGPRESACWVLPMAALADGVAAYAAAG